MSILEEGQHNKTALKIVFLAGGSGSGKNYIANKLFGIQPGSSFSADGFKLVSFDRIFENMLKQHGIDPASLNDMSWDELRDITDEYNPKSIYSKSRVAMRKQFADNLKAGNGIIYDGTGQKGYLDKQRLAKTMGYDTFLVFVDAPLETALARNAARKRRLPNGLVRKIHDSVQAQRKWFKQDFGDNMIEINNDEPAKPFSPDVLQKVRNIINSPVKNVKGRYFLKKGKRPWLDPKPKLPKDLPTHKPSSVYSSSPNPYWDKSKQYGFFPDDHKLPKIKQYDFDDDYNDTPKWGVPKYKPQPPKDDRPYWERFKEKQAQLEKEREAKKRSAAPPAQDNDDILMKDRKIHNPETGNDIYLRTALHYPVGHPMRIAAEAEREKIRAQNNKPPQQ